MHTMVDIAKQRHKNLWVKVIQLYVDTDNPCLASSG